MRQEDLSMTKTSLRCLSEYDDLSEEYYDAERHPTCANFYSLSYRWIRKQLSSLPSHFNRCLEIGAGYSIMAKLRSDGFDRVGWLAISDKSELMLNYSRGLAKFYDEALILDIEDTENAKRVCSKDYDLVVASLADPYNGPRLWQTLNQIMATNGRVVFTTPSYEWTTSFRKLEQAGKIDLAEFVSKSGDIIYLRSDVLSAAKQIELCYRHGFRLELLEQVYCDDIPVAELSWKLDRVRGLKMPALTGYMFVRDR